MILTLTKDQIINISRIIENHEAFESVYNSNLYPSENYDLFKKSFSSLSEANDQIFDALRWKWGHWNKKNFPKSHQALIKEIEGAWRHFIKSSEKHGPQATFNWWKEKLRKDSRYITTSYITHLVHSKKGIVIIDQHNFRAMNFFLKNGLPQWKHNKKPSKWSDIENISYFSKLICSELNWEASKLDRILMIYGRDKAPRK